MSKLLAGGFLAVLVAEVVGVMLGWRWALPIGGVALAVFGIQLTLQLASARHHAAAPARGEDAIESLRRWKAQTEELIRWADCTRGDWDRYLRPKLARDFLMATKQKEPAAIATTGRILFGEELWPWVDPQNAAPGRRDEPGPGRDALEEILKRLEQT